MNGSHGAREGTSCAACDGALATSGMRLTDHVTGERFTIVRCASCGLGHTHPVPRDLAPYYAGYHGGRHGPTASLCAARRARWLRAATVGARGRVLDVGCGDGTFLARIARDGYTPVGTEIEPALSTARAQKFPVHASLDEAERDGPFLAATLFHSLQHLEDPRRTLERVATLLVPGGALLVAVPDRGGLAATMLGASWDGLDVPRHLHHYDLRSLGGLLGRAGLRVVETRHLEIEYDVYSLVHGALAHLSRNPTALFDALTGKPAPAADVALGFAIAASLAPLAVAGAALAAAARRGGTLVAIARR